MAESVPARTLWYQPELPDKPFLAQPRTINPYLLIYWVSFMFQPLRIQRWVGPSVCLLRVSRSSRKKALQRQKGIHSCRCFQSTEEKATGQAFQGKLSSSIAHLLSLFIFF